MKKLLLLTAGGAVGWTLGARAGRPAYDRMVHRWSGLAESLGLGQLASTVKEAGIDVRDSAVNRVSTKVSASADGLADRIEDVPSTYGTAMAPSAASPLADDSVSRAGGPVY
jgi:hypothetical protein